MGSGEFLAGIILIMKNKYLISPCLLGINCRYDGKCQLSDKAIKQFKQGNAIAVCPEQLAGFPTPRVPIEIKGKQVLDKNGKDVTKKINKGVNEALKFVDMFKPNKALLKDKSPTCGVKNIYDGSHSGKTIPGSGLFTRELKKRGIAVEIGDK